MISSMLCTEDKGLLLKKHHVFVILSLYITACPAAMLILISQKQNFQRLQKHFTKRYFTKNIYHCHNYGEYSSIKSTTMQLTNYLPIIAVLPSALALPAPALISTNPNAASLLPMCTKQMNPNTCVLNWNTNTMAVNNDLSNINNIVPYARVTIYSNTCTQIGGITNGLAQNVLVDAVGFGQHIVLHNVWDEAKGFKVPRWDYNGKQYTVDNCACFDGPLMGEPKGTHVCECPFECHS